jgi:hypothetical protein
MREEVLRLLTHVFHRCRPAGALAGEGKSRTGSIHPHPLHPSGTRLALTRSVLISTFWEFFISSISSTGKIPVFVITPEGVIIMSKSGGL